MSDITGKDQKKKERLSLFPYLTQSLNAVIVLYVTAKKKTRAPESMQKVSKQWATLVSHSSARPKSYNDTCNQLLAQ